MGRILNRNRSLAFTVLALLLLVPASAAFGQALDAYERELIDLVERVRPSVVTVRAMSLDRSGAERVVLGSGVVIDDQGTIATLGTVVRGATLVELELLSGRKVRAIVLGVDERMNIAILEAESADELTPLPPAPTGGLRVGAFALSAGNPFGLTGSVGTGIISGLKREVQGVGLVDGVPKSVVYYDMVQTTAPINPGDSGGALVDSKGRMIGMISSTFGRSPSMQRIREMIREFARKVDVKQIEAFLPALDLNDKQKLFVGVLLNRFKAYQESISDDETDPEPHTVFEGMPEGIRGASLGAQGINFAIPVDQVHYAARMIRLHGEVIRLGLRADLPDAALRSQAELMPGQGLVVSELSESGAAARSGIRQFDILLSVAGRPVGHPRDLRRALLASAVDAPIAVTVRRGGETLELLIRY